MIKHIKNSLSNLKTFDLLRKGALFVAFTVFAAQFSKNQTDGFSLHAISSNRPYNERFACRELTDKETAELEEALGQSYDYFGCGGQAYAFFSEDGKYVIKFFKQRLFKRPLLVNALPLPKILHRYREKRNWKRDDKLERDFFSYKTAFEDLQEHTGVLYSHLNKTVSLNKKLQITDPIGIRHHVDLDQLDFIVQRRAERTYDRIDRLAKFGRLEEAKQAIASVFDLIAVRAQKGYRDRDPNIRTNCGFVQGQAVKIDVGRFVISDEMKTEEGLRQEVLKITTPFGSWLETHHPELAPTFYEERKKVIGL